MRFVGQSYSRLCAEFAVAGAVAVAVGSYFLGLVAAYLAVASVVHLALLI